MKTRTRNLKRLLSLALCLCMVTGLLPMTALAADAPAITAETLEAATVDEPYTAQLTAKASDAQGALTWSSEDLPGWLTLSGSGETATLTGTPDEAGEGRQLHLQCRDPERNEGEGTEYELWLDPDTHALLQAEVSVDGICRLELAFTKFTMEMTQNETGDHADLGGDQPGQSGT